MTVLLVSNVTCEGDSCLSWFLISNYRYSYDYGMIHMIMLSTEHDFTKGSPQIKWLENDLKNADREKTPRVFIGGHRPMYNSEIYDGDIRVSLYMRKGNIYLLKSSFVFCLLPSCTVVRLSSSSSSVFYCLLSSTIFRLLLSFVFYHLSSSTVFRLQHSFFIFLFLSPLLLFWIDIKRLLTKI